MSAIVSRRDTGVTRDGEPVYAFSSTHEVLEATETELGQQLVEVDGKIALVDAYGELLGIRGAIGVQALVEALLGADTAGAGRIASRLAVERTQITEAQALLP